MTYIERAAETALRKILNSDEPVQAKSEYLARVLEAVVRSEIAAEAALEFERIKSALELDALSAETREDEQSLRDASDFVASVQERILKRLA